jgi:DNA-dependent protein kinase catalytic subunit
MLNEEEKFEQIIKENKDVNMMEVDQEIEEFEDPHKNLELDEINLHPCMRNILDVIDTMQSKFSGNWREGEVPLWMQKLKDSYSESEQLTVKLFILKIIVNRPKVFYKYGEFWFDVMGEYVISKENGGKGFHYFLRDICSFFINDEHELDLSCAEYRDCCTKIVNALIKYAPDKRKAIFFDCNLKIIEQLIRKWQTGITSINEAVIKQMLSAEEK